MGTWNRLHTVAPTTVARLRHERGQALVEFALVLPVLMLIIVGILYFGRYESYASQMTQLAEQGARDGAVNFAPPNSQSLAAYIQSQGTGELAGGSGDVSQLSVSVVCSAGSTCTTASATSTVTVCTAATVQVPFLKVKTGTIFQKATMRVEQSGATASTAGPGPPACS